MRLNELKEGRSAIITFIDAVPSFQKRLRDIGFCEGERVHCVKRAVLGSPVLYRVKGTLLALRKGDSCVIGVEE
jgi:Fe2+ transport system protein FeoA